MNQYKFEGVVDKIISDLTGCKVKLIGTSNFYNEYDGKKYNLLWDNSSPSTVTAAATPTATKVATPPPTPTAKTAKALNLYQEYIFDLKDQISINLLVNSDLNNKPIEVLIEEDDSKAPTVIYKIISISTLSKKS